MVDIEGYGRLFYFKNVWWIFIIVWWLFVLINMIKWDI